MQTLTETQFKHNVSIAKRPIWVTELMFTNGVVVEGVNDFYFASSERSVLSDGVIKSLPAENKWYPFLDPLSISAISQKVDVITGVSTIGNLSFSVVDSGGKISEIIGAADSYTDAPAGNIGYGLNRQFIDLYLVYEGDSWDDRRKVRRMQVSSVKLKNGVYTFSCEDIQRAARTKVFIPSTGSLLSDITPASTTLSVGNTESGAFPFEYYTNSLGQQIPFSKYHIKIGDEVMEVVSRNELTQQIDFTVVRAKANTVAAAHSANDDVSEVVQLAGDPLDIAIQTLTGQVAINGYTEYGLWRVYKGVFDNNVYPVNAYWGWACIDTSNPAHPIDVNGNTITQYSYASTTRFFGSKQPVPMPASMRHWHCGMDIHNHINMDEWTAVKASINSAASPFEFWLNKGEDGKLFIEREIMQVLGLFLRVKGDGSLGLRAYNDIADGDVGEGTGFAEVSNGDYRRLVIDDEVLVKFGSVDVVRKGDLMTAMSLEYDYQPKIGGKPRRIGNFIDLDGEKKHGFGRSFTIKSRGVIAQDTSALNAIYSRVSRVLARFSRPPMRLSVTCLPKMSPLDLGDVVRVKLPQTDPFTGQDINRRFEILQTSLSPKDGTVAFDLVAQPEKASITNFRKTSGYLDSAFLNGSAGTALTAADLAATKTLQAGDYYYVGDATISGNWTIHGTVRILCSGTITVTGTIDGKGNGITYDGYASAGAAGGDGWFTADWEEGVQVWLHCEQRAAVTSRADVRNGYTGGTTTGQPTDIIPTAYDAAGKVTSISGLDVSFDGAVGGYGSPGISNATTGKLYKAASWALTHGYAEGAVFNLSPLPAIYGTPGAKGGAGLDLVGRKVVLETGCSVDLSGADAAVPAKIVSPRIELEVFGCNDYITHTFQPGKGGAGGGGTLRCIAESGIAGGIFFNQQPNLNGGDTAAGKGKIIEVLL